MASSGTSIGLRSCPALRAGWLAIDARTTRQLLAGTLRTARLFRYYDAANARAGHWDAFFEREPLVQYAALAEIDVAGQERLYRTVLHGVGPVMQPAKLGDQAGAWTVIDDLIAMYARVDNAATLFEKLPAEAEYAGMLRQAIVGALRAARAEVLQCRGWLKQHGRYPFEEPGWPGSWPDADLAVHSSAWEPAPPVGDPGELTPVTFADRLAKAAWSTHSTVAQLVSAAANWFQLRLATPSDLAPHFALYLAFLRQFGRAQAVMNDIPRRHRDYFYREVLQLAPAPATPDRALVSFKAAPASWTDLPAGTAVSAGKDPAGLPIVYATDAEVLVTPATVAHFSTLFLAAPVPGGGSGFYYAPVANSADGNGAALPPGSSWATFGEEQSGRATSARTMQDAQIGFAVTSPVLALGSGRREIELVVAYSRPDETLQQVSDPQPPLPAVPGIIEYSGANGWVTVPAAQTTAALHYGTGGASEIVPLNATFTVTLAPGDPACVNYDPKALGPGYDARVPALRVRFTNPLTAFPGTEPAVRDAFLEAKVTAVAVRVTVTDLVPDVVVGPTGTLAPGKPMPVFGAPVLPAATFQIGSVELFRKQPQTVSLTLDWVGLPTNPNGLGDYFGDYLIAFPPPNDTVFRNDQYRVLWSALFDCAWVRLDRPPVTPPPTPDGPYLFRWDSPATVVPPPPAGLLQPSSRWDASATALEQWRATPALVGPLVPGTPQPTGYLQLTLNAPDYLFGQPVYPTVVSDIALANALTIATASKPPPPPPKPDSYSPAAAFRILVTPAPVSTFFQRVGSFLHLAAPTSATFKPQVAPAVTAAGGFAPEVKAALVAAGKPPDGVYAKAVEAVTKPPQFSDVDSFVKAMGDALGLSPRKASEDQALDEVLGWMASLLFQPPPPTPPVMKPLPRPPLVPTASQVRLSYTAEARVDLELAAAKPPGAWDRMWHLSPTAVSQLAGGSPLLPPVARGGTLLLGIAGAQLPQTISLLFVLEDLTVTKLSATLKDEPVWSVLAGDTWRPASAAVHRGTDSFLRTGIVRIDLAADLGGEHTVMPADYVWVRAEVSSPASHLRTIQVLPNAAQVRWVPPAGLTPEQLNAHFAAPLAAGSITGLVTPIPAIAGVLQPLPSFGGIPPETEAGFVTRVSERLRHKGRAVAARDYERIVLQQFPTVFFARAIPPAAPTAAPTVTVMVLPVVTVPPASAPPGFVPGELQEMAAALAGVIPLSAAAQVVNPDYEPIQVSVTVSFDAQRSSDYYVQQLTADLAAFVSPWIYRQAEVLDPVQRFHVSDFATFIRERPYVVSVGTCTVAMLAPRATGPVPAPDVIAPSGPRALLIAADSHRITVT